MTPFDIFGKVLGGVAGSNPLTAVVAGVVTGVIQSGVNPAAVPAIVHQELKDQGVAVVPVKSAWKSKINWVAGISLLFGVADFLGHPVPTDVQDAISKVIMAVAPLMIIVFRSWFNNSATK